MKANNYVQDITYFFEIYKKIVVCLNDKEILNSDGNKYDLLKNKHMILKIIFPS